LVASNFNKDYGKIYEKSVNS